MLMKSLLFVALLAACYADKYTECITKSIKFYEAQRSGSLPSNNRIPWRKNSCTNDRDGNVNLSGGWFDAGDYVKFGFPMAWATTVLAWGMLEFKTGYERAGEYNNAKNQIKWTLDYFIKCHPSANEFYVQVGNGNVDHDYYGRPEQMNIWRPAYKINTNKPGSDIAAETAAAMAAGFLIFKDTNWNYANSLRNHAKQLFAFAKNNQRKYSDHGDEFRFYTSSGFKDELVWAAAWLYKATNDNSYKQYAENNIDQLGNWPSWAFGWDDKKVGAQMLLYQITNNNKYKGLVEGYLNSWKQGGGLVYTPKGLAWRNEWGPTRYAANTATIALMAAKKGINVDMGGGRNNKNWAIHQIDIMLGTTGGRSYVVGYGNNPPKRPHHRSSSCPKNFQAACNQGTFNAAGNNPNVLEGALVGGPDRWDNYKDDRKDYIQSEVAVDYNAGFQTALAGIKNF